MSEEHNVNVNIRIQDETGEDESAETGCESGDIIVSRAQTSRYKTYQDIHMPAGKSIGEIRNELWRAYDLSEKCVATVDGVPAGDEVRPRPGQCVRFSPAPKERGK